MYSLNLLTMGVAEPVAECEPRICDGRKPDIGVMTKPVQEETTQSLTDQDKRPSERHTGSRP